MRQPIIEPWKRARTLVSKKNDKKFKKIQKTKNCKNTVDINNLKNNHQKQSRSYTVFYNQTFNEVGWHLRLEKPGKWQIFEKLELQVLWKNAKIRDVKMLKTPSITVRIYAVTYYQTLQEVRMPLRFEKRKKWQITWWKNWQLKMTNNLMKKLQVLKKFAKICDKMTKSIPWPIKKLGTVLSNARIDFLTPGARKT